MHDAIREILTWAVPLSGAAVIVVGHLQRRASERCSKEVRDELRELRERLVRVEERTRYLEGLEDSGS